MYAAFNDHIVFNHVVPEHATPSHAVVASSGFDISNFISNFVLTWIPVMFFVLMCVVVYLLWKTVKLMPRVKPMEITPGSASAVTWADVAGLDEAKEELQEIVDFLRDPDRFEALGARVPKGILFHGPPGTGKTLAAKAVANESGARFYAQSASAFVEMFAGLGAARIRKLFEEARKNAPSIVFIDELDAVGMARSGNGFNREQDQTLNQLLVELDGFGPRDQVVVMGASNRLQDLDPALLRPGRFDRQVLINPPDLKGRRAILDVHTRGKPLDDNVNLDAVSRQTAGLTGADLQNICNEAAIAAGRNGRATLTQAYFDYSLERVVAGLQQRRVVTDKEKRILAYHEGGHALMSHLVGNQPEKATIIARGTALGYVLHLPEEERYLETREELLDWMVMALSGRAAEQIVFGRVTPWSSSGAWASPSRRARCAPTTTPCPRKRNACVTPSRLCSPTRRTPTHCASSASTARPSIASRLRCSTRKRSTAKSSRSSSSASSRSRARPTRSAPCVRSAQTPRAERQRVTSR
jgi:cell division protease FtsH